MWKSTPRLLLALVLAAVCLPQSATQLVTLEIRRVGDKLACKCRACNNTVGTCPMLRCHYAEPAREKIAEMQKAGAADQSIVDTFVKESGLSALATPPAEGFNLLGWIMPFIALLLGLSVLIVWLKKLFAPRPVTEVPEIDSRYRERIERELEEIE